MPETEQRKVVNYIQGGSHYPGFATRSDADRQRTA
jgi:hypothetical protein